MNIVKAQRAKWLRQAQQNQRRSLFPVHFFTFHFSLLHFFTSSLLRFFTSPLADFVSQITFNAVVWFKPLIRLI
jgi:hypothetical protein